MKDNRKEIGLTAALFLLGVGCAAAGVILSIRLEKTWIFTVCSIPAAMLLAGGGMKLYNLIRDGGLGSGIGSRARTGTRTETRTSGGIYKMPRNHRTEFDAEVMGVTRNLRLEGEKEVFYIVCRYVDPDTGEESTYTSRPLSEYPGKEVIGKTVHVTVDPHDPGKYQVDIDPILTKKQTDRTES